MKVNNLNPNYTFDNFIVGKCNRFAHNVAKAVADNPGKSYNPLFIFGNGGLGKTHLIQAIGNKILQNNPKFNVCYMRSDELLNEIINSLKESSENNDVLINKFDNIDVLLIDDIQFIAEKERCEEELRNIFNKLYYDGKQIVITGEKYPNKISGLDARLQTRFSWGIVVDISIPDYQTRLAILDSKATESIEKIINFYNK